MYKQSRKVMNEKTSMIFVVCVIGGSRLWTAAREEATHGN